MFSITNQLAFKVCVFYVTINIVCYFFLKKKLFVLKIGLSSLSFDFNGYQFWFASEENYSMKKNHIVSETLLLENKKAMV
jgi:hypothetical protein